MNLLHWIGFANWLPNEATTMPADQTTLELGGLNLLNKKLQEVEDKFKSSVFGKHEVAGELKGIGLSHSEPRLQPDLMCFSPCVSRHMRLLELMPSP